MCASAEAAVLRGDPKHPLRDKMVKLPSADERKERYGGINRRERWCRHLGISERAIEMHRIKDPQIRWTHFPRPCWDWESGGPRRMLHRIVPATDKTEADDVIQGTGTAIATPNVVFGDDTSQQWKSQRTSSSQASPSSWSPAAVDGVDAGRTELKQVIAAIEASGQSGEAQLAAALKELCAAKDALLRERAEAVKRERELTVEAAALREQVAALTVEVAMLRESAGMPAAAPRAHADGSLLQNADQLATQLASTLETIVAVTKSVRPLLTEEDGAAPAPA
mmetsp:Transcript_9196/g.26160  ORF Transcript_9196/g.26160 Transcript_9196/m.26160 type:complete len:281 (-) Transcript_9196:108-950(-)